ncbi:MAG TPA: hypothetical protein VG944_04680 [Fimbriimonas sp.]|nr:hypothetical protein [Fimbriimonas sp.]
MRTIGLSALGVISVSFIGAGCGGGVGSKGAGAGTDQTLQVGRATIKFSGPIKPSLAVSSGGATVAGAAGAAMSFIEMVPAQKLVNSNLAYSQNFQLWVYSFATGKSTAITHYPGFSRVEHPTWGPNGQIAFSGFQFSGGNLSEALVTMLQDGSQTKYLTGPGVVIQTPAWSVDGLHIAGVDSDEEFVCMNANGTSSVTLDANAGSAASFSEAWAGNGALVYNKLVTNNLEGIFTVPSSGGTPVQSYFQFGGSTTEPVDVASSPDGKGIYFEVGAYINSVLNGFSGGEGSFSPPGTTFKDSIAAVSPDNTTVAFHRQIGSTVGDGVSGIYLATADGSNPVQLLADGNTTNEYNPAPVSLAWSPFYKNQVFIGSGGTLGSTASGFLFGQNGDAFSSFLSFTAKTPSTATITAATPNGNGAALAFTISADSITRIAYTNTYYGSFSSLSPTGVTKLIVTFSGTTGQVDLLVPAAQNAPSPTMSRTGGNLVYAGRFAGVFDGHGKNLAPNGASQVVINSKTGDLVTFHA